LPSMTELLIEEKQIYDNAPPKIISKINPLNCKMYCPVQRYSILLYHYTVFISRKVILKNQRQNA
jgi:hypothetical protein